MNKQEVFQAVYQTFQNHDFEASTYDDLRNNLKKKFDTVDPNDLCYNLVNQILQVIWNTYFYDWYHGCTKKFFDE